ncbi:hypothetical protein [Micromonospora chalcea]|uniref:hypothetical protein n=1 Tax=Micromonospora chalcea TaxID=1874 RepID=UPI003D72E305
MRKLVIYNKQEIERLFGQGLAGGESCDACTDDLAVHERLLVAFELDTDDAYVSFKLDPRPRSGAAVADTDTYWVVACDRTPASMQCKQRNRDARGLLDRAFAMLDKVERWSDEECCGPDGLVRRLARLLDGSDCQEAVQLRHPEELPSALARGYVMGHVSADQEAVLRIFALLREAEDWDDPGLVHTAGEIMHDLAGYRFHGDADRV